MYSKGAPRRDGDVTEDLSAAFPAAVHDFRLHVAQSFFAKPPRDLAGRIAFFALAALEVARHLATAARQHPLEPLINGWYRCSSWQAETESRCRQQTLEDQFSAALIPSLIRQLPSRCRQDGVRRKRNNNSGFITKCKIVLGKTEGGCIWQSSSIAIIDSKFQDFQGP